MLRLPADLHESRLHLILAFIARLAHVYMPEMGLQPSQNLFELVKLMFREAWTQRLAQAEDIVKSGKNQIKAIEKQVDALLVRIIDTTNPTVIRAYEGKISELRKL